MGGLYGKVALEGQNDDVLGSDQRDAPEIELDTETTKILYRRRSTFPRSWTCNFNIFLIDRSEFERY